MKFRGYVLGIISSISYGLIPLFILPLKQAQFSLNITLFYRFFFSALLISIYLLIKKEKFAINKKETFVVATLGICYALSSEFLFLGYDLLTPAIASTVLFVYPVIVALIMFFFFKETLSKLSILSLVFAFLGVIVLCLKGNSFEINIEGLSVVMLSSLFYALYIVIVNKSKIKLSGFKLTFYSMLFTALLFMGKSIFLQESFAIPSLAILSNFIIFALLTTVISSLCLVFAIKDIGSTPVAILGALEPVVAVLISVLLFHEKCTINLLMGISLILLGVILNIISGNKKKQNSLN